MVRHCADCGKPFAYQGECPLCALCCLIAHEWRCVNEEIDREQKEKL